MIATFTNRGREIQIGRAPRGGIDFVGKHYRGGQFCPVAALPIKGGAPKQVKVDLAHTHDTWGSHGQHNQETDYVRVGEDFVRCDSVPGALVDDQSAHSRKNQHTKILVEVELEAGTLGYTWEDYASSSGGTTSRNYWRIGEDGSKEEYGHRTVKINQGKIEEVFHELSDGERVLVRRAPLGVRTNSWPGTCGCGAKVAVGSGELYKTDAGKWAARCVKCFEAKGE